jgi:glycosyltransferase involved in cell wall biosynthesis
VLSSAKNKRLALISHDLSQSGSPLLLVETAVRLREAGADVQLVTLAGDADGDSLAARHGIPVVPLAASFARCADADLVIANTAETASWIRSYLRDHPQSGRTLVWWIHEINARDYADQIPTFATVRALVFDSHASLNAWATTELAFPPVVRVIHPCVDDRLIAMALQSRYPYPNMDSPPSRSMRAARRLYRRMGLSRWLPCRASAYDRATIRRSLGIEPHDYVVTLVGVFQTRKGHALLAETVGRMLEENPRLPLKLLLVGFSDVSQTQRFLAGVDSATRRALDPRRLVTVVRSLAPYYAASDAFVMNSQGAGENFGRVTIEAMAFKLPVLGTNAGGTLEIVEDRVTGLLHRVGAAGQEELAENICVLARNRENGIAMGEAGYRRVRDRFTRPRFDAEFDGLLRDLLTDEPR